MFVEAGEECDCGLPEHCDNPCCNPYTCKLHVNATCATGECCDTTVLACLFFPKNLLTIPVKLNGYFIYSDLSREECRNSVPLCSPRVRPSRVLHREKRILPWGSLQVGRHLLRSRQSMSFFLFFSPNVKLYHCVTLLSSSLGVLLRRILSEPFRPMSASLGTLGQRLRRQVLRSEHARQQDG